MRDENRKRGNGEADGVKRRALKEKRLVLFAFFSQNATLLLEARPCQQTVHASSPSHVCPFFFFYPS